MSVYEEMIGKTFNRLTVLRFSKTKHNHLDCVCSCGQTTIALASSIKFGNTKSCGCLQKSKASKRLITHGLAKSLTHRIWCGMKSRCLNEKATSYKYYGGSGITVCDRWLSFENFVSDMGECPENFSIDRIDVNGNYEPSNCRWADKITQQRNKSVNSYITFENVTLCKSEWAQKLGIDRSTINKRIRKGMPIYDVLSKDRVMLSKA